MELLEKTASIGKTLGLNHFQAHGASLVFLACRKNTFTAAAARESSTQNQWESEKKQCASVVHSLSKGDPSICARL